MTTAASLDGLRAGPGTLLVAAPAHDPTALTVVVPAGQPWSLGELRLTRRGSTELPAAGVHVIDTAHSTVSAKAHHLGLATVTGRFTDFAGAITVDPDVARSRVAAEIVATSIETGNAQRDAHLRSADFLDVEHHPFGPARAGLPGQRPDPWGGTRAAFTATTELRRQDFQLNWDQAVGVGIAVYGTTLRVTLDVEAVLQT